MEYWQVAVFAEKPLSGNGVAVFPGGITLDSTVQQALAMELRQMTSVFLSAGDQPAEARIFTMTQELSFGGHSLLGACALRHHLDQARPARTTHSVRMGERLFEIVTERRAQGYHAELDQGPATFGHVLDVSASEQIAQAFALRLRDLDAPYPPTVVKAALPFLIVPVKGSALGRARLLAADLEPQLAAYGAAYAYLLDVDAVEGRIWDNQGVAEERATGGAAAPVCAYLERHGRYTPGTDLVLTQGDYTGRSCRLHVRQDERGHLHLGAPVRMVSRSQWLDTPIPS